MNMRPMLTMLCVMFLASLPISPAIAARADKEDTIKSLEKKTVKIRPGKTILSSSDLARENYEAFLDLVSDDPELRAEAMRRLGDLELEATEADQLAVPEPDSKSIPFRRSLHWPRSTIFRPQPLVRGNEHAPNVDDAVRDVPSLPADFACNCGARG